MLRRALVPLLFCGALSAQPQPDLTKPPETPPIPDYKLPPVYQTKLANGLQVVLVEDKRFPLITSRLLFYAGSKFDPPERPGLAASVAALLTEGTKTRTQRQIAEELASIGGALSGSASPDTLSLSGGSLSEHLSRFMTLLADVAMNAGFPDNEVQLHKENGKQALIAQRTQPAFLAREQFSKTVFGEANPHAHISTTMEALDKLDAAALAGYRDSFLVPNNGYLILLGSIPARAKTMKLLESHFGKWQQKQTPPPPKIDFPESRRQIVLVDRPGSVQANIHIGQLAVSRKDPQHFPLMMGNVILGGGMTSRMFSEIREKQGFAYDAHSEFDRRREIGVVKGVTQVRNEVIEPALAAVLKEMEGMAKGPVSNDELTDAKNFIAGNFLLGIETQGALVSQLAMTKEMDLPVSYLEQFTQSVRSTEPDAIQAAAKKYIAPDDAAIIVVGDASKIQKALEKYGEVRVVKP
jgi:zinc protease